MEKRKIKLNSNLVYLAIVILVILIFVFGRKGGEDVEVLEEELGLEESGGSGFLEIETFPSNADIYVDKLHSGKSPITLYNIPVGSRSIIIRKEGYEDFVGEVSIEAGKKTFLEARLALVPAAEEKAEIAKSEEEKAELKETAEEKEEISAETPKDSSIISLGKGIVLYYDFSKKEFISNRQTESDVFSKRYAKHLVFTRYIPANIKVIGKNIDEVKKEDCSGITGGLGFLNSGQSLCVITKEKNIVALGGTWENTENAELKWKLFD